MSMFSSLTQRYVYVKIPSNFAVAVCKAQIKIPSLLSIMTKKNIRPGWPGPVKTRSSHMQAADQAIRLAEQHHAAGRPAAAEDILRRVLHAVPGHPVALHLLGIIAHQSGKTEYAIRLLKLAIEKIPANGQFHANLGEMCRVSNRLDEAVAYGERAVALDPGSATAHSNLGIALYDRKEPERAEACQKTALAIHPKLPQALNNLGSIQRDRKDSEGAIRYYRQALAVAPEYFDSLNNLGATLNESERPDEAVGVLLQAIRLRPRYAGAHYNIANAFLALEQFDKASLGFSRALELKPDYQDACIGLARSHQAQKKFTEAAALAARALAMDPKNSAACHCLLGGIHAEAGYPEQAEHAYDGALELQPDLFGALMGKGQLLLEQGRLKEAEGHFRQALSLNVANLAARLALVQVQRAGEDEENMAALLLEAEKIGEMPEGRALSLHFALGKQYDDAGQPDLAMHHLLEGNRLKRKRVEYSPDNNDLICTNICQFFSPENISRLSGAGCPSELPIFVLGMPRSGTSLVEQILASHPLVYGAGELQDLLALAAKPTEKTVEGYPLSLIGLGRDDLTAMGERYVAGLRSRNQEAQRITDKMPANFHCVGLIHLMLPRARIIHVRRNPVDTCLSGFSHIFNNTQQQSYDLAEIGRYYRNYATLMDHWRSVLPAGALYEVQYEQMVTDQENQSRALLASCGLEWDAACLEFHKTRRQVRTASATQVRQPIYTSSVERWRKYEAHLGPLLDALGDLAPSRAVGR